MEATGQFRAWEEMIPDALGLIFSKLPLQEILTVLPCVCKSWRKAISGPYCWQEIKFDEWSQCKPGRVDKLLRLLVTRSSGSLRKLYVSGLSNDSVFSFIADSAKSLQCLELPRSEISNDIVKQVAGKLCNVTFLDLSYCQKIGASALEAFGKNCKSLQRLRRVMHPLEVAGKESQDDEAHAIACTMPNLKHLEMAYLLISNAGFLEILSGCKHLEYLDVRGCWNIELDENLVKARLPLIKILGPTIVDYYEGRYFEESSDFSDTSSYLDWAEITDDDDFEYISDDDDDHVLEVTYYGGGFISAPPGFDWPPSP